MIEGIHGVKQRLLIFLVVFVVRQRLAFHQREQRDEVSVDPSGFAANQFRHIGVLLLRHDARAGTKAVRQGNKVKLLGGPKHHLFAPAGHMCQT